MLNINLVIVDLKISKGENNWCDLLVKMLQFSGVDISQIKVENSNVEISIQSKRKGAKCPSCGKVSYMVRGRYLRKLMSLPIVNLKSIILFLSRKFKCNNQKCQQKIFTEQNTTICERYSRKTIEVTKLLEKIVVEISSNKGSYILGQLNIAQSSSTCLRIVRNMPLPTLKTPQCIGVDDWAKRRGQSYGTIITDASTGKVLDLIDSRDALEIIPSLSQYSDAEYVTRDRSRSYAKAISAAIPAAKQIADKFHIAKNLSDAIYLDIKKIYPQIKANYLEKYGSQQVSQVEVESAAEDPKPKLAPTTLKRCCKTGGKFNEVKQMQAEGLSGREIARRLSISRTTVRRFVYTQK